MKFSDAIKMIRRKSLLSQSDFANELGVSFSTVNRWENGKAIPKLCKLKLIKNFCITLWYYISLPYNLITTRRVTKILKEAAEDDRRNLLTEKDVEFLRSIGVETDLETLRNGDKPTNKNNK